MLHNGKLSIWFENAFKREIFVLYIDAASKMPPKNEIMVCFTVQ